MTGIAEMIYRIAGTFASVNFRELGNIIYYGISPRKLSQIANWKCGLGPTIIIYSAQMFAEKTHGRRQYHEIRKSFTCESFWLYNMYMYILCVCEYAQVCVYSHVFYTCEISMVFHM